MARPEQRRQGRGTPRRRSSIREPLGSPISETECPIPATFRPVISVDREYPLNAGDLWFWPEIDRRQSELKPLPIHVLLLVAASPQTIVIVGDGQAGQTGPGELWRCN